MKKIIVVSCVVLGVGLAWGYSGLSAQSIAAGMAGGLLFGALCAHSEYLLDELLKAADVLDC